MTISKKETKVKSKYKYKSKKVKNGFNIVGKYETCSEKKCPSEYKNTEGQFSLYYNKLFKVCPEKLSRKKFTVCSAKLFKSSNYKKTGDEYTKCRISKCKSLKEKVDSLLNKSKSVHSKFIRCKNKKCASENKNVRNEADLYFKNRTKACPYNLLSLKKYTKCTKLFSKTHNYKKIMNNYNKCSNSKCKSLQKTINNIQRKLYK